MSSEYSRSMTYLICAKEFKHWLRIFQYYLEVFLSEGLDKLTKKL